MELKKYIAKGKTFSEYYNHVNDVEENGDTNDSMHSYYSLNNTRMNRLKKRIQLTEDTLDRIKSLKKPIHLLILTEGWCGDAAQILPVIEKVCEASEFIHEHIFLRDENLELMDAYLTNGGRAIPMVIGVDESGKELFHWGPRPGWATPILADFKSEKTTKDEFLQQIQKTYNKDKGQAIQKELIDLMLK